MRNYNMEKAHMSCTYEDDDELNGSKTMQKVPVLGMM
jgi:hypothetical protein